MYNSAHGNSSAHCPGWYVLVTSATHDRWPIFKRPENCELFLETLQHYRREGKYLLHDFVVMPDHIHLPITPQGISIERVVQLIKGGFSHRYGSKHSVWQKGFTDHRCRYRVDFLARRKYIRQNPVTARLVPYAEDYPYSSAYRKAPSAAEAESEEDGGSHG